MDDAPYRKLKDWLIERFGEPVHKVGVLAGFPCPNRDGTLSSSGCSFCNPVGGIPPGIEPGMSITEQLDKGTEAIRKRFLSHRFIAYFQDCTPTNCPPRELRAKISEALQFPGVAGVALCTRPDCMSEPMMDMLEGVSRETLLWIELGLQSSSEETLGRINRNHGASVCAETLDSLHTRGILTVLHVMIGLPGETRRDVLATADFVRETGAWGVKLHNLYILEGTLLEKEYLEGRITLPTIEEYAELAALFVSRMRPGTVVHRLVGAPSSLLVAPRWCMKKQPVIESIERALLSMTGCLQD
jgi:radical SAM protein (TIGR01212 family)